MLENFQAYWNSIQGNLAIGLNIMGTGTAIVFLVLAILYVIIKLMGKFVK